MRKPTVFEMICVFVILFVVLTAYLIKDNANRKAWRASEKAEIEKLAADFKKNMNDLQAQAFALGQLAATRDAIDLVSKEKDKTGKEKYEKVSVTERELNKIGLTLKNSVRVTAVKQ